VISYITAFFHCLFNFHQMATLRMGKLVEYYCYTCNPVKWPNWTDEELRRNLDAILERTKDDMTNDSQDTVTDVTDVINETSSQERPDRAPRGHELITRGPTKEGDMIFVRLTGELRFVGWRVIRSHFVGLDAAKFEGIARRVGQR
jgi:hypothetical protein